MSDIVVLSATRTPLGAFQGSLARVPAPRLGALAIRSAVEKAGIAATDVSDVYMGNVLQAGVGQAPARQAALYAGLPAATRTVTINKVCGSGLEAVIQGARSLPTREATFVVAGGMENMSAAPYLLRNAREGFRLGHQHVVDSLIHDGLWARITISTWGIVRNSARKNITSRVSNRTRTRRKVFVGRTPRRRRVASRRRLPRLTSPARKGESPELHMMTVRRG